MQSKQSRTSYKQLLTEDMVRINGVKNLLNNEYKIKSTCSLIFKFTVVICTWLQFFNLLDEVDFLIIELFVLCKKSNQHMISWHKNLRMGGGGGGGGDSCIKSSGMLIKKIELNP